jgi:hypothetical protein
VYFIRLELYMDKLERPSSDCMFKHDAETAVIHVHNGPESMPYSMLKWLPPGPEPGQVNEWLSKMYTNNVCLPSVGSDDYHPIMFDAGWNIGKLYALLDCSLYRNVLLFCSSRIHNVSSVMNQFLSDPSTASMLHLTIIHETDDTGLVIYDHRDKHGRKKARKIVNVFPIDVSVTVRKCTRFNEASLYRVIDTIWSPQMEDITFVAYNHSVCDDQQDMVVLTTAPAHAVKKANDSRRQIDRNVNNGRFKSASPQESMPFFFQTKRTPQCISEWGVCNLESQWWYRWYHENPACAVPRLLQFTGTCWLNALLNTILLSAPIADRLRHRFSAEMTPTSACSNDVKRCILDQQVDLDTKLRMLARELVLNSERLTPNEFDSYHIVPELARHIKYELDESTRGNSKDYVSFACAIEDGFHARLPSVQ